MRRCKYSYDSEVDVHDVEGDDDANDDGGVMILMLVKDDYEL